MRAIGVDFGSVTTKAVLVDSSGSVELSLCSKKGENAAALGTFLAQVARLHPGERFSASVAGSDPSSTAQRRVPAVSSLAAIARGVRRDHPRARSVIEIGGHASKFVIIDRDGAIRDFATNEACAAGTGSFLEQQAKRLTLTPEELATMAIEARTGATVAGRCSVFAKSDMIHLQQKGTPVGEIAYGLCLAICRNALTTLLKGRDVEPPVVIAGGCAHNAGVVRAFRELLAIPEPGGIVVSSHPGLEAALGAALSALENGAPPLEIDELARELRAISGRSAKSISTLAPLPARTDAGRLAEPASVHPVPATGFLGVDLGSVSTDLVVLDEEGELLSSVYLPTRGRPVDVLLEGLAILSARFPAGLTIAGCGTTGSGRHLAASLVGADVVRNEITCQVLGARRFLPEADTILEIGGQDSKFISLRDGMIADFAMNKICAAGTGSFLEEQARELGDRDRRRVRRARLPREGATRARNALHRLHGDRGRQFPSRGRGRGRPLRRPRALDRPQLPRQGRRRAPSRRGDRLPGGRRIERRRRRRVRERSRKAGPRPPVQPDLGRDRRRPRGAGRAARHRALRTGGDDPPQEALAPLVRVRPLREPVRGERRAGRGETRVLRRHVRALHRARDLAPFGRPAAEPGGRVRRPLRGGVRRRARGRAHDRDPSRIDPLRLSRVSGRRSSRRSATGRSSRTSHPTRRSLSGSGISASASAFRSS